MGAKARFCKIGRRLELGAERSKTHKHRTHERGSAQLRLAAERSIAINCPSATGEDRPAGRHHGRTAGVSTSRPRARSIRWSSSSTSWGALNAKGSALTPIMQLRRRRFSEPTVCHSSR